MHVPAPCIAVAEAPAQGSVPRKARLDRCADMPNFSADLPKLRPAPTQMPYRFFNHFSGEKWPAAGHGARYLPMQYGKSGAKLAHIAGVAFCGPPSRSAEKSGKARFLIIGASEDVSAGEELLRFCDMHLMSGPERQERRDLSVDLLQAASMGAIDAEKKFTGVA